MKPTVPVVMFVYNRVNLVEQTLAALEKNPVPLLIIYSDGPNNKEAQAGVRAVRKLVKSINWVPTRIVERPNNMGLSASIKQGLNNVFDEFDRAIILEDDICVAPNFYAYMTACLEKYKDDQNVATVTATRYPFDRSALSGYKYDVYFTQRFSSWGWGTWARWWKTVDFDVESLRNQIKQAKPNFAAIGRDLPLMVRARLIGESHGAWDIDSAINVAVKNQLVVAPAHSLVNNTGYSSGTHTSVEEQDMRIVWEDTSFASKPLRFPPVVALDPEISKEFAKAFDKRRPSFRQFIGWTRRDIQHWVKTHTAGK